MARTKEFDRDEVLDRAMQLFWSRGYEATSIGDLVERLGIGRQSLYDTFGDKHTLYLAALDRYRERHGGAVGQALAGDTPIRRAIRELFQAVIELTLADPGRSCMLISAAAERCPTDGDVRQRYCAATSVMEKAFAERVERARAGGEIASHHDARALARFFVTALQGLQLRAKGGGDRRALEQVAETTVSILG